MSSIKRLLEEIWDLHWQGKSRVEIMMETGCDEQLYDDAMELLREIKEDGGAE